MGFANMYGGIRTAKEERNENDAYPTHPFVTYSLLRHSPVPKEVWEPAAGRGWMVWELLRNKRDVLASDLYAYPNPLAAVAHDTDFLKSNLNELAGFKNCAVVTNPPYGKRLAQKFIEHALKKHQYVAMLCRLTFAESEQRYNLFTKHPPSHQLIFSSRFSCEETRWWSKKSTTSGMVAYAWWIWDQTYSIEFTCTSWINTKQMYDEWVNSLSHEQREWFFNTLPQKGLELHGKSEPDGPHDKDD